MHYSRYALGAPSVVTTVSVPFPCNISTYRYAERKGEVKKGVGPRPVIDYKTLDSKNTRL